MDEQELVDLRAELEHYFDRTVELYYWALDHEQWTMLWNAGSLIDRLHELSERVA